MEKMNMKQLMNTAIITALGVLIMLFGLWIPSMNILLLILPVPYIIHGVRNGLMYSTVSLIATSIIVALFISQIQGLLFICSVGIPTIAIAFAIQSKHRLSNTMIIGTLGTVAALVGTYLTIVQITGVSMFEVVDTYVGQIIDSVSVQLAQMGNAEETTEMIRQRGIAFKVLFPSMIIFVAATQTYIYVILSRFFLTKLGYEIKKANTLSYFSVPTSFVGGSLIITVLSYIAGYFNIVNGDALLSNILYVGFMVMVVQGMSILSFILEKRGVGNTLRRVIIGAVFLLSILNIALALVGMMDILIDIRRINKPTQ